MIAWFPRHQMPMIAAGPAEPGPSHDRCWADDVEGRQCAVAIDEADLLGLCERHRDLLRDGSDPEVAAPHGSGASPMGPVALSARPRTPR
ncbi:MAG TPA: hypothetical protein VG476_14310 [Acidimicrobiales bacterium]|nr:hypothetical protein [Acidimicrobiales bacterium]